MLTALFIHVLRWGSLEGVLGEWLGPGRGHRSPQNKFWFAVSYLDAKGNFELEENQIHYHNILCSFTCIHKQA